MFNLFLGLSSGLFPAGFPTKTLYARLLSNMVPLHYSYDSSWFVHPNSAHYTISSNPLNPFLLGSNIFLSTLLSDTHSMCSSFKNVKSNTDASSYHGCWEVRKCVHSVTNLVHSLWTHAQTCIIISIFNLYHYLVSWTLIIFTPPSFTQHLMLCAVYSSYSFFDERETHTTYFWHTFDTADASVKWQPVPIHYFHKHGFDMICCSVKSFWEFHDSNLYLCNHIVCFIHHMYHYRYSLQPWYCSVFILANCM
jgi:hypothetical protein